MESVDVVQPKQAGENKKEELKAKLVRLLRLNLKDMTRNFYLFTVMVVLVGLSTGYAVKNLWDKVEYIKDDIMPRMSKMQDIENQLAIVKSLALRYDQSEGIIREAILDELKADGEVLIDSIKAETSGVEETSDKSFRDQLKESSSKLGNLLAKRNPSKDEIDATINSATVSLKGINYFQNTELDTLFAESEEAYDKAKLVVVGLSSGALIGMIAIGLILSNVVSVPVSRVTDEMIDNSQKIEDVYSELSVGTQKQKEIVENAIQDLEDMIINTIQGNLSLSVEKQNEIAGAFADFLRHFVERSSAEVAMGMLSIAQQSEEARESINKFTGEIVNIEGNIKNQEQATVRIVETLQNIVQANEQIKTMAKSSTVAADLATDKAIQGQERISAISNELEEIKSSSVGVREITNALGKITESIKILALNMSLKVEDIKDDTGKSYGFEAMSARVQELAEEVEKLLVNSQEMITPTIDGIEKVSNDAIQSLELIIDLADSIKVADSESQAISAEIDRQAEGLINAEKEAEDVRATAEKTTASIGEQAQLIKEVDEILKDSVNLIEVVNEQTQDSVQSARKLNDMMDQLKQSVVNIEEGTGLLTEKTFGITDMFTELKEQADKNEDGARRLEVVTGTVRGLSYKLQEVVRGERSEGKTRS